MSTYTSGHVQFYTSHVETHMQYNDYASENNRDCVNSALDLLHKYCMLSDAQKRLDYLDVTAIYLNIRIYVDTRMTLCRQCDYLVRLHLMDGCLEYKGLGTELSNFVIYLKDVVDGFKRSQSLEEFVKNKV
jgi:hypothetical protein